MVGLKPCGLPSDFGLVRLPIADSSAFRLPTHPPSDSDSFALRLSTFSLLLNTQIVFFVRFLRAFSPCPSYRFAFCSCSFLRAFSIFAVEQQLFNEGNHHKQNKHQQPAGRSAPRARVEHNFAQRCSRRTEMLNFQVGNS